MGVAWTKSNLEVLGSVFYKVVLEVTQPFRVTPFNSWGLSLFLSCGSAPKFKGSFRTARVTGRCPPRWMCRVSCWGCWEAGQQMRFVRCYSWQSYQLDSVWCAKTCKWDWRKIYSPPALDGLRWSAALQSVGCLQHPWCFPCITAQTASVCNALREIAPFHDSKHHLMDTPKQVLLTFVSFYNFGFVSFLV